LKLYWQSIYATRHGAEIYIKYTDILSWEKSSFVINDDGTNSYTIHINDVGNTISNSEILSKFKDNNYPDKELKNISIVREAF
jgi:hypothetical protein